MSFEKRMRRFQKEWKQGKYKTKVQRGSIGVAVICAVLLGRYYMVSNQEDQAMEYLREIKEQSAENAVRKQTEVGEVQVASQYEALFSANPDLIGWLTIEGTAVDYPVMWTPEEPEYYSHRGFDKKESQNGLLFMDEVSSLNEDGGNIIIYGHNMKNGSMFADLLNYKKESYWKQHPSIQLDTLTETRMYEITAVAATNDLELLPYSFTSPEDANAEEVIETMKANSLYDTGIEMELGDDFLTLSTCDYSVEDGRLVVMARRIQ